MKMNNTATAVTQKIRKRRILDALHREYWRVMLDHSKRKAAGAETKSPTPYVREINLAYSLIFQEKKEADRPSATASVVFLEKYQEVIKSDYPKLIEKKLLTSDAANETFLMLKAAAAWLCRKYGIAE